MVLDTNILIYYLNAALDPETKATVDNILLSGAHVSVITRIEVLGWPGYTASAQERARRLLDLCDEYPLIDEIAEQCIALRQQRRIKLPDAVIAATALYLKQPLVTRNTRNFAWIDGLQLINPFER